MSDDARLAAHWEHAWRAQGIAPPAPAGREALLARYAEPARHYHTAQHLLECLDRLASARDRIAHAGEPEVALWYHDAVYDPERGDNEERSAALAADAMTRAGAPGDAVARVRALILATQHAAPADPGDAALVVDADLGILAAPEPRFDEYERQVREEYRWVPGPLFRARRRAVLRSFLERARIYTSGAFDADERTARENLARSIAALA